ncbi:MAG TPA: hypothetical protein VGD43_20790 [Micromonospora sp.]
MVYVKLDDAWTDDAGVTHAAGEEVDVDAGTLAKLQAEGIVGGETNEWAGPGASTEWAGPGSAER